MINVLKNYCGRDVESTINTGFHRNIKSMNNNHVRVLITFIEFDLMKIDKIDMTNKLFMNVLLT